MQIPALSCEEPPFAPHQRVLAALGLTAQVRLCREIVGLPGPYVPEEQARAEIVASIDSGVPAIAMGIIGPPECCVVYGYGASGDTLVGWNYFQGDEGFDPEQPFGKTGWFGGLGGYLLLSSEAPQPSERDSALAVFRAITRHAREYDDRGSRCPVPRAPDASGACSPSPPVGGEGAAVAGEVLASRDKAEAGLCLAPSASGAWPGTGGSSPARLLALERGHWQIENRDHYVKDVTLGGSQPHPPGPRPRGAGDRARPGAQSPASGQMPGHRQPAALPQRPFGGRRGAGLCDDPLPGTYDPVATLDVAPV